MYEEITDDNMADYMAIMGDVYLCDEYCDDTCEDS